LTVTSQFENWGIFEETRFIFLLNLLICHGFSEHFSSFFFSNSVSILAASALILLAVIRWMANIFDKFAAWIRLLFI